MWNCEEGLFYIQFKYKTRKMKPLSENPKKNALASLLKIVRKKFSGYFEPEEVEVTFEDGGKEQGTYTYTVLPHHKQVA